MELDAALRRQIYDRTVSTGTPPTIAELADAIGVTAHAVRNGLASLAAGRMLVLQPGTGEILMAPPFSAVPTPFVVTADRPGDDGQARPFRSYANCAWDALGVPIMMRSPARLTTACGCCGEAMVLDVDHDRPPAGDAIVHFAVPALRWWQDIVFT